MSENSLEIRQKFISKILRKVDSLEESLTLLGKVDKKMLRRDIQIGGARLQNLQQMGGFWGGVFDMDEQPGGAKATMKELLGSPKKNNVGPTVDKIERTVNKTAPTDNQFGPFKAKDTVQLKEIQKQALISRVTLAKQKEALLKAQETISELNNNLQGIRKAILSISQLMQGLNMDMPVLEEANIPGLSSYDDIILWNAFKNIPFDKLQNLPTEGDDINQKLNILMVENYGDPLDVETKNKLIGRDDYEALLKAVQEPSTTA